MHPSETTTLEVKGLRFVGPHGVWQQERDEGRLFKVDLAVQIDPPQGALTDELEDTLDYRDLVNCIMEVAQGPSAALVEHMAQKIADRCLALPGALRVDLTLHKKVPELPGSPEWIGVKLTRFPNT